MVTFQPPDLKDMIRCALNAFEFLDGEISDILFSVLQEETQTDDYDTLTFLEGLGNSRNPVISHSETGLSSGKPRFT